VSCLATVSAMRAVTVVPLQKDSVDRTDMAEPPLQDGPVLVPAVVGHREDAQHARRRRPPDFGTSRRAR